MQGLIDTQQLINDFAKITRSIYMPGTDNWENDVHHSASVAFLAWQVHVSLNLNLDMAKVMKYALAHDIVEIYAGDVNAYASKQDREQKKVNEAKSLKRIEAETSHDFPELTAAIKDYEAKINDEARFVWSVDKIQALLQGGIDNNRPFYGQGITLDDVRNNHGTMINSIYEPLQDLYREVYDWFISNYYDKKVDQSSKPHNNRAARK